MKIDYVMGIGLIILALILIIAGIIMVIKKSGGEKGYDERQIAIQGKSYKAAFLSLLIYLSCFLLFRAGSDIKLPIDDGNIIFIGMCISLIIFASINILKDAYFENSKTGKSTPILLAFVCLMNLVTGIYALKTGRVVEDGVILFRRTGNFIAGTTMFIILLVTLIKKVMCKKDNEK